MTSQGSALMRFERAVRTGNPNLVIAAAHELPRPVLLRDALRVLLVLAVADADRYPAAAARFGARLGSSVGTRSAARGKLVVRGFDGGGVVVSCTPHSHCIIVNVAILVSFAKVRFCGLVRPR
jgi:hypothetical protein